MRRYLRSMLTLAVATTLVLTAAACSATSDQTEAGKADETSAGEQSSGPMSGEDLAAALEAEYGSAEWYPHVQWIGRDQVLLAPMIRVETDLEMGDYDVMGEIANAVASLVESEEDAMNIQVVSASGTGSTGRAWGSEMGEVMDLPAAPTTAEELKSWIDTVYGESGEDWYAHVQSISVSDNEPGWQSTTMIVVKTDLPDRSDESYALARRIGEAIVSTGQTIAENYIVQMSSGEQMLSGDLPANSLKY